MWGRSRTVLFIDGSYAFLTPGFEGNVVTHLLADSATKEKKPEVRIAIRSELGIGDVLLFIRGSSRDAIREVADQNLPVGQRDMARLWQRALQRYKQARGLSAEDIHRRLREATCTHHLGTIRTWLTSDTIIAPRDAHAHELEIIKTVTQDEELIRNFDACDSAIRNVWGAHLSASSSLAAQVLRHATGMLSGGRERFQQLDLGNNVILATIDRIQDTDAMVRRSLVNRLLDPGG